MLKQHLYHQYTTCKIGKCVTTTYFDYKYVIVSVPTTKKTTGMDTFMSA